MLRTSLAIATALLAVTAPLRSASGGGVVLFVDDDAPPGGHGESWKDACRHRQDALATAAACHDRLIVPSPAEVRCHG